MKAKEAQFVTSATKPSQYPPPTLPEVAVAGRSNVGKSSLINALVGRIGLAKTSSTPGRTRLLNWFRVVSGKGTEFHLVDLPGYGYAKVPRAVRDAWRPMIEDYLGARDALCGVVLLIDARRGAQDEELSLVEWLAHHDVPVVVVLTKCDKLPKSKRKPVQARVKRELALMREPIATSAAGGDGLEDLWRAVARLTTRQSE